jgi:hypothetical protein
VALKKKPEAKAKSKQTGKEDKAKGKAAPRKAKPVKPRTAASKKPAATKADKSDSGASTTKAKRDSGRRRKTGDRDAVEQRAASETKKQEQDPFEVAKQTMKGSVPAIVEAMVELAKQGSCTHAKTLLEMTGAKHMFDGEADARESGEPWAKLVLERLGEAESRAEQETVSSQLESKEGAHGR